MLNKFLLMGLWRMYKECTLPLHCVTMPYCPGGRASQGAPIVRHTRPMICAQRISRCNGPWGNSDLFGGVFIRDYDGPWGHLYRGLRAYYGACVLIVGVTLFVSCQVCHSRYFGRPTDPIYVKVCVFCVRCQVGHSRCYIHHFGIRTWYA